MFATVARFAPKKAVANKLNKKAYDQVLRSGVTNEFCDAAAAAVFTPVKFAVPSKAQLAKKQAAAERRALRRKQKKAALAAAAAAPVETEVVFNTEAAIQENIQEVAATMTAAATDLMSMDAFVQTVEITAPTAEAIEEPSSAVAEEEEFSAFTVPESVEADAESTFAAEAQVEEFTAAPETTETAEVEATPTEFTAESAPAVEATEVETEAFSAASEVAEGAEVEATSFVAAEAEAEEQSADSFTAEAEPETFTAEAETETFTAETEPETFTAEAEPETFTAETEPETFTAEAEPETFTAEPVAFTAECDAEVSAEVEESFVAAPEVPVAEVPSTFESAMSDFTAVTPVSSSVMMVQEAVEAATTAESESAVAAPQEIVEEPVVFRNLF